MGISFELSTLLGDFGIFDLTGELWSEIVCELNLFGDFSIFGFTGELLSELV